MTKILLLTHFYPAHKGGVEIAAGSLAQRMSKKNDLQITWLASDCDKPPTDNQNLKYVPLKSFNFIEKIFPFPYPILSLSSIFTLKNFVKNCDILHLHDFIYFSNFTAYFFAKLFKKKIILTQHIGFIPYKNPALRFILSAINKTLGRKIISDTYSTVFISRNVLRYYQKICGKKDNFKYLPNGTDFDIYNVYEEDKRDEIRSKINLNRFTFLFVGRFTEKKGIPLIKNLALNFTDCDFIFAGWGSENPEGWNLPNVKVFSGLQGKEIANLYNACDILILPAYGEGFPLVVQEALACGLDIIVSDEILSACPEMEMFTKVVYYKDFSFEIFKNKISSFIKHYFYSKENRLNKQDLAHSLWNWDHTSEIYLKML